MNAPMTPDAMRMTPAEVRVAIAKKKGYSKKYGIMDAASMNKVDYWVLPEGWTTSVLPDWPSNIADAWELESEIPETDFERYANYLEYVVAHDTKTLFRIGQDGKGHVHTFFMIHATAEQRSRAWLMWKEGEG